jgi:predicted flap endonuclease-1-like 5' DNA nuclease
MNVVDVEGIGPKYAAKLKTIGIVTTDDLLKKGATPKGRQEIEAGAGIGHELVLDWVNRVDLYRIKGIGSEYSDLLELAGVDTVKELATRNAANLVETMTTVNAKKKAVRRLPTVDMVTAWIAEAKKLPRVVEY